MLELNEINKLAAIIEVLYPEASVVVNKDELGNKQLRICADHRDFSENAELIVIDDYAAFIAEHQDILDQNAAIAARAERDKRLAACDWTQALDVPEATRNKFAAYRQALRDVPDQAGFPHNVAWPVL